MPDDACAAQLDAFSFTLPVTLEDLYMMYDAIRALPWSSPPVIDLCCHDGKTVELLVDVGGQRIEKTYQGY